jgi:glycerol-3-phosphate acyltransferase PlsY
MVALRSVVTIVSAYLLGSIPVGLLLVRATRGTDVREVGSGRTGGTNVLRAAGPWVGLLTALIDGAKGLLAVVLARVTVGIPAVEALAGVLAVVGHNHSVFIGFKGGAGTACAIGGAIGLWPWNAAILICAGGAVFAATGYASVGSMSVALLLAVVPALRAALAGAPWAYLIHGVGASAFILWSLRPNIRRLLGGRERRVTLRKST